MTRLASVHRSPISARNLSINRGGKTLLSAFSLNVEPGQIATLLGPSGAGKTTFLRSCIGLEKPDTGTIEIFGKRPGGRDVAAKVGLLPQGDGVWPNLTANQLLRYLASLYQEPIPTGELISQLGINNYQNTIFQDLSAPQRRTVQLAAALLGRPALLLLDEPTAGLSQATRAAMWQVIHSAKAADVAVVVATQDTAEAAELSDTITILVAGQVASQNAIAEQAHGQDLAQLYLRHQTGRIL